MEAAVIPPPDREQIHRFCVLLGRTERVVRRSLAAPLNTVGLTFEEFFLLSGCDSAALPGQSELTALASLSPAQTSTLLDGLRQRSWLTPERDPADRRRQVWGLTNEGRAQLGLAWQALAPVLAELQARLAPAAWDSLARGLAELANPPAGRRRCA
jgi:DNA-binding MarR family transcriptional regulator